jgi:nitroreductase
MATSVSSALQQRKSIRAFLSSPSPPSSLIASLLTKASRSPSGGNTQPWHVHVLMGEVREKVGQDVLQGKVDIDGHEYSVYPPPEASQSYMERRREVAAQMYDLMGIDRKDHAARTEAMFRNYLFFDAPVGLIITVDRIVDRNGWGHVGMFIMSFCLLAEEAGLSTCLLESWGGAQKYLRQLLTIPDTQIIWCGIAVGYPDLTKPVNKVISTRIPLNSFAKFHGCETPTAKL